MAGASFAETREQCEADLRPASTRVIAGSTGTAGGAILGATACSGLLGLIFADLGLSYVTCVAVVTTAGGATGTVIGDNIAHRELARCRELPAAQESLLAQN